MLATGLTDLSLNVNLVSQVHHEEVFLLLSGIEVLFDLLESLLWAKMRLVIKSIDSSIGLFDALLFSDLVSQELTVSQILASLVL